MNNDQAQPRAQLSELAGGAELVSEIVQQNTKREVARKCLSDFQAIQTEDERAGYRGEYD